MIPLFKKYPTLENKIRYISLGNFPTPVEKLKNLGEKIGCSNLYVKRDDISGKFYGGNKVRKLEFILADAINHDKKEILTFGYAGSNHALATAVYSNILGLKSISMLLPQDNARYVRNNLLVSYLNCAELHLQNNKFLLAIDTFYQLIKHKFKRGKFPLIVPPGGSSIFGILGFINAAFELKEQIDKYLLPIPKRIYIPLGSGGTAIGLIFGFKLLNLNIKVICVRVAEEKYANYKKMIKLFNKTNDFLCNYDNTFPRLKIIDEDIIIRHEFYGKRYALFTRSGVEAIKEIEKDENINLEGTYTGKTLDALITDVKKEKLINETILFWNTYNSINLVNKIKNIDFHLLPKKFFYYFKNDVQPLDNY